MVNTQIHLQMKKNDLLKIVNKKFYHIIFLLHQGVHEPKRTVLHDLLRLEYQYLKLSNNNSKLQYAIVSDMQIFVNFICKNK